MCDSERRAMACVRVLRLSVEMGSEVECGREPMRQLGEFIAGLSPSRFLECMVLLSELVNKYTAFVLLHY